MKVTCSICFKEYKSYKDDHLKCFSCNRKETRELIKLSKAPKIVQRNCTAHLDKETKKKICSYIVLEHGSLFKTYKESVPFIKKAFDIEIDFKAVRSLVNSEYYRNLAFD